MVDTTSFVRWPCPLCGGEDGAELRRTRDYNWGIPGEFCFVRCRGCGLVRQDPRPTVETLPSLYPSRYGTAVSELSDDPTSKIFAPPNEYRRRAIERATSAPGTNFDVGCGSGFFLELMRRRGWTVHGVDASEEHVAYAREALGLDGVTQSTWPAERVDGPRPDVVTMFHTIEHLSDPLEALSRARDLLSPDGVLVLETPNVESWPMGIFGDYCMQLDAPRHLCLFSRSSLERCLHEAGFENVETTTFAASTMEYTESLRYLVQARGLRSYRSEARSEVPSPAPAEVGSAPSSFPSRALGLVHAGERWCVRACEAVARMAGRGANLFTVARR